MGAAADPRSRRPAPLRFRRRRRSARAQVRLARRRGLRSSWRDRREVRHRAAFLRHCGRNSLRLLGESGRLRVDECGAAGAAGGYSMIDGRPSTIDHRAWDQKLNFTANWKFRWGSAPKYAVDVIRPAFGLLLPGTPISAS